MQIEESLGKPIPESIVTVLGMAAYEKLEQFDSLDEPSGAESIYADKFCKVRDVPLPTIGLKLAKIKHFSETRNNENKYFLLHFLSFTSEHKFTFQLFPGKLEIMCFYFPTTKSKTVRISDIKTVFYKLVIFRVVRLCSEKSHLFFY